MINCSGCGMKLKSRFSYSGHAQANPDCTPENRFWGHVDKITPNGCWVWTATQDHHGYGSFRYDGKNRRTNRLAWILTNGPIPNGMHVLHRCDNPPCVNPAHMFLGSHHEDMLAKRSRGVAQAIRFQVKHIGADKTDWANFADMVEKGLEMEYEDDQRDATSETEK